MNTPLHDLMHRAVEDTAPDLERISTAARSRGLAIRRRRQALSVVGAALAVAVIVVGAQQLSGPVGSGVTPAGQPSATPTAPESSPAPQPGRRVPMTGRMVAAALWEAVHEQIRPSGGDTFQGQSSDNEAYAEMRFRPLDLGGYSLVGINVQPGFANEEIYRCTDSQVDCRIVHPYRGATLMTYEDHTRTPHGTGIRRVADLLRADGVRVVASSANGRELSGNRWDITRDKPPLSYTQLYLVVSNPWFGPTMDERFARVSLSDYTDLDSDIGAWDHGTPTPTP